MSLLGSHDEEVTAFGCRCLSRMAIEGKRRRLLHCGGTAAALAVVRRRHLPLPLLIEALTVLLNISSEPTVINFCVDCHN